MSVSVNLLPSSAKFQAAKTKLKKYTYYFSIGFVSVYLLVVIVVFGINFLADNKLKNSQKAYEQAQNFYNSLNDNVVTTQKLKYQAKLVGKVLNDRFEYGAAFKRIGSLFEGLQVNVLGYKLDKGNTFRLTGTTEANKNMDEVEKKIIEINQGKVDGFESVKLTSLSVTSSLWKFDMEVAIK